jgi:hypothetical protein
VGKVTLDSSVSLDGVIAGPNDDTENPLGVGGQNPPTMEVTGGEGEQ